MSSSDLERGCALGRGLIECLKQHRAFPTFNPRQSGEDVNRLVPLIRNSAEVRAVLTDPGGAVDLYTESYGATILGYALSNAEFPHPDVAQRGHRRTVGAQRVGDHLRHCEREAVFRQPPGVPRRARSCRNALYDRRPGCRAGSESGPARRHAVRRPERHMGGKQPRRGGRTDEPVHSDPRGLLRTRLGPELQAVAVARATVFADCECGLHLQDRLHLQLLCQSDQRSRHQQLVSETRWREAMGCSDMDSSSSTGIC